MTVDPSKTPNLWWKCARQKLSIKIKRECPKIKSKIDWLLCVVILGGFMRFDWWDGIRWFMGGTHLRWLLPSKNKQ